MIGFLIAVATSTSFAAVVFIDPGTASLLARMGTIFSLAFGLFWLKESLTGGEQLGAALAVIGFFLAVAFFTVFLPAAFFLPALPDAELAFSAAAFSRRSWRRSSNRPRSTPGSASFTRGQLQSGPTSVGASATT